MTLLLSLKALEKEFKGDKDKKKAWCYRTC